MSPDYFIQSPFDERSVCLGILYPRGTSSEGSLAAVSHAFFLRPGDVQEEDWWGPRVGVSSASREVSGLLSVTLPRAA